MRWHTPPDEVTAHSTFLVSISTAVPADSAAKAPKRAHVRAHLERGPSFEAYPNCIRSVSRRCVQEGGTLCLWSSAEWSGVGEAGAGEVMCVHRVVQSTSTREHLESREHLETKLVRCAPLAACRRDLVNPGNNKTTNKSSMQPQCSGASRV